jgi:hypothetical protein
MQIILDSNAYVADFRMQGISFSNLFDFVRKTKSQIILPRIVREEVIHIYSGRFQTQANQVARHWNAFQPLLLDRQPDKFERPELKHQLRELRKLFKEPTKGVTIEYLSDVSGIDLNEVALRGIKRIPPANLNGEELRDVMIWFQVLWTAKRTEEATAFVTNDAGFWDDEAVKGQINDDIINSGRRVTVHKTIDHFIKANSLKQTVLSAESANKLIPASLFSAEVAAKFLTRLKRAGQSYMYDIFGGYGDGVDATEIKLLSSRFVSGTEYEIDERVSFISAAYKFDAASTLKLTPRKAPGITGMSGIGVASIGAMLPAPVHLAPIGGFVNGVFPNSLWQDQIRTLSKEASELTKEITATGSAVATARVVNGEVAEKALEDFVLHKLKTQSKEIAYADSYGQWLNPQ